MSFIVPYGIRLDIEGRIEVVPVAQIRVKSGTREVPGIFVIDSGATISLLPAADAKELGIDIRQGVRVVIRRATGHTLVGYRHTVVMEIGGVHLRAVPVIFARGRETPRVLSREGLFPRFGIMFDEARRRVAFLAVRRKPRRLAAVMDSHRAEGATIYRFRSEPRGLAPA